MAKATREIDRHQYEGCRELDGDRRPRCSCGWLGALADSDPLALFAWTEHAVVIDVR